jgi:hypothetical protein
MSFLIHNRYKLSMLIAKFHCLMVKLTCELSVLSGTMLAILEIIS